MSVPEEKTEVGATKSDLHYVERRIESAYEDRQKMKKMIRTIVAVLVDKKLVGENLAKAFTESKEKENKLIEWVLERYKKES